MTEKIWESLDIPYISAVFSVSFRKNTEVPQHKVSALRGGMGQKLLEKYCIGDKLCEICGYEPECIVRQMMYSKYEIQPVFASRGDSNGYVIECLNNASYFMAGEEMEFSLILYGRLIKYFPLFVQAFRELGEAGIGKKHAEYDIVRIKDDNGNNLSACGTIVRPEVLNIQRYVLERKQNLILNGFRRRLLLQSPVTIKYEGKFIKDLSSATPLIRSIYRRIYVFDCFLGKDIPLMCWEGRVPEVIRYRSEPKNVQRFSETQGRKMTLRGICGLMEFDEIPDELLLCFLAGEKLHIGKNTSFGFGKYILL